MGFFHKIGHALKSVFDSTGLVIWVMGLMTAAMMGLQKLLYINATTGTPVIQLPLDTAAWGLTVISAGYMGTDRVASFVKTQSMTYGNVDLGDVPKLRRMLILLFLLIIEGLALQILFNLPNVPLNTLLLAFIGTGSAYAIGNKAVKAAAHMDGTHDPSESQVSLTAPTATMGGINGATTVTTTVTIPKP